MSRNAYALQPDTKIMVVDDLVVGLYYEKSPKLISTQIVWTNGILVINELYDGILAIFPKINWFIAVLIKAEVT
jgi:hypothetical protein